MKRKVIGQGNNTLTVTLPRKWSEANKLRRGDELDVNDMGDALVLSAKQRSKKIEIDISGLDHNSIRQNIRSYYKKGYDEITIKFRNSDVTELRTGKRYLTVDVINEEVNLLLGCQIIHQAKNRCTIKDFTFGSEKEFENALRRIFLLIIDYGRDFYSFAESMDKTSLAGMRDRHFNIGKFIFYCLRLINKGMVRKASDSVSLYYMITTLDDIIDIIKYASVDLLSFRQKRLENTTLRILKEIEKQNRRFYEFFYSPNNDMMIELAKARWNVRKKERTLLGRVPANEQALIVMMRQILELYYHISEPRLALELG